jgi:hypothetical protein
MLDTLHRSEGDQLFGEPVRHRRHDFRGCAV